MAQLWLANVPLEATTCRALSDRHGASPDRLALPPPETVGRLLPRELAELEASIARDEWAADGGDGHVWSDDDERDPSALNLEWLLHGALIEAMAAIVLRPDEARSIALEQSEKKPGVAE